MNKKNKENNFKASSKDIKKLPLRRRPRVFLFWTMAAALITGIYFFYIKVQSPAVGKVGNKSTLSKNSQPEVSDPTDEGITSKLATFNYPGVYRLVRKEVNPIGIEQYLFATQTDAINSNKIGITIKPNGVEGGYKSDSGYKLRKSKIGDNSFSSLVVGAHTVEKSTNKSGTEVVYFFQGDLYYASVAGTSSDTSDEIELDLKTILKDWAWLK